MNSEAIVAIVVVGGLILLVLFFILWDNVLSTWWSNKVERSREKSLKRLQKNRDRIEARRRKARQKAIEGGHAEMMSTEMREGQAAMATREVLITDKTGKAIRFLAIMILISTIIACSTRLYTSMLAEKYNRYYFGVNQNGRIVSAADKENGVVRYATSNSLGSWTFDSEIQVQ